MKQFTKIDELKFRASYGLAGNPSIRPYQSLSRLNDQGYSFGGTPSAATTRWPSATRTSRGRPRPQADYGIDLGFLERYTLTADYYQKRTTDLLLQISLPRETGFESALANRGVVENKGFEFGSTRACSTAKGPARLLVALRT
jgi:hypothetical protein